MSNATNKVLSLEYNGKSYQFILTKTAKTKISDIISKSQTQILSNSDDANAIARIQLLQKKLPTLDETSEDYSNAYIELVELSSKFTHLMDTAGKSIDPFEVGYLVLSSYIQYRDEMTRELYDKILEDFEYRVGLEEFYTFFNEVYEMVFTLIEKLDKIELQNNLKSNPQSKKPM